MFESNKVIINIKRNKLEIIKITKFGKSQSIPKKFVTKKYENIIENTREETIIGINKIKDSNIIILKTFTFSKPKILKTRF